MEKQGFSQALASKRKINGEPAKMDCRQRVARQLCPDLFWQAAHIEGTGRHRIVAGYASVSHFHGHKSPAEMAFFILRNQGAQESIKWSFATGKLTALVVATKALNEPLSHV